MLNTTKQYALIRDLNGTSYLGGDIPEEFKIPENNCPGSFQYLGFLSKEDKGFSLLQHSLHLICPIYMNIDKVWLDYSNPLSPTIINLDEINTIDTAYDDLTDDSIIIYEKVNFVTTAIGASSNHRLGISGKPNWIQDEDIPKCPKTNEKMKFLCQIEYQYSDDIKTKYTNVSPEDEWYKQYFETMNFWSDGDLYIFFAPESNIACYFIQNT